MSSAIWLMALLFLFLSFFYPLICQSEHSFNYPSTNSNYCTLLALMTVVLECIQFVFMYVYSLLYACINYHYMCVCIVFICSSFFWQKIKSIKYVLLLKINCLRLSFQYSEYNNIVLEKLKTLAQ